MLKRSSQKTENVFEILLGSKNLKWDPIWNLLQWLCLPNQGHGLRSGFQEALTGFAYGEVVTGMSIEQEFRVDPNRPSSVKAGRP